MLSVKLYLPGYIKACRHKVQMDVAAFHALSSTTEKFEAVYFNNMVLVLEQMFVHRMRGHEGKDGNPLNEVRMIANSILTNDNVLVEDSTIRYKETKSVSKLRIGGPIAIKADSFIELANAFFKEIEQKF